MIDLLASAIVSLAGLYLIALAVVSLVTPARARRFLLGFAGSPAVHYLELALRLVVGWAFVVHAPGTRVPAASSVFGWVLVATTGVLLLVPWQLHRRFAARAVPRALAFLPLLAAASLLSGGAILYAQSDGAG